MNFTIKSVITEEDRNLFYDLPQSIYQHDSNWIPHLKQDVEYVFNEKKK